MGHLDLLTYWVAWTGLTGGFTDPTGPWLTGLTGPLPPPFWLALLTLLDLGLLGLLLAWAYWARLADWSHGLAERSVPAHITGWLVGLRAAAWPFGSLGSLGGSVPHWSLQRPLLHLAALAGLAHWSVGRLESSAVRGSFATTR